MDHRLSLVLATGVCTALLGCSDPASGSPDASTDAAVSTVDSALDAPGADAGPANDASASPDAAGPTDPPIDCATLDCFYVRDGSSGDGTDWNVAFDDLPDDLQRGAVYFVATGTYAGHVFDAPEDGETDVVIRRATLDDHGTEVGWNDALGTGDAVFEGALDFETDHWVFDGRRGGGPGSWTENFGFRVIELGGRSVVATGFETFGRDASVDPDVRDIVLRHLEIVGNDGADQGGGSVGNDGLAHYGGGDITVSYAYLHAIGRAPIFSAADHTTFELSYVGTYTSTDAVHSEVASVWPFLPGTHPSSLVFRYNVFAHLEGTGGLIIEGDDVEVYGNVWMRPPGESFGAANGAVGTWTASHLGNIRIYDNAFIDLDDMPAIGILNDDDTGEVRNNVFYRTRPGGYGALERSHNHYVECDGPAGETAATTGTGDPFVDFVGLDFALLAPTEPGMTLPAPYDVDWTGTTRGDDGVWDRGALEH